MKKIFFALMLLAIAAPAGAARADSDEWREGYWEHAHKQGRDRGGWHEGRHEGWDNGDGGASGGEEPVDEATDAHVGSDD